jgi:hypothetical protein
LPVHVLNGYFVFHLEPLFVFHLAPLFQERNPGVKNTASSIIQASEYKACGFSGPVISIAIK